MEQVEKIVKTQVKPSDILQVEKAVNEMLDRLLFSVITENSRLKSENYRLKRVVKTVAKNRGFEKIL